MTYLEDPIERRAIELRQQKPEYEGMFWSDLYPHQQQELLEEAKRQLKEEA